MRTETTPVERTSLTLRIEALSSRIDSLLSETLQTAAPTAGLSAITALEGGGPVDDALSDYPQKDQISYLQSALSQRSAEAEEWMSADRSARELLASSQAALSKAEAALSREQAARTRAEEAFERLTLEIEELTLLLLEVEEREAHTVAAGKAEAVAALSKEHGRQIAELELRTHAKDGIEQGLADERARTDQYRDVAEKMQALCVYQNRELALLRERIGDSEQRAERQTKDFDRLMNDYRKIRQTTSWKATAPIRSFFKMLKRLLRGQRQPS